MTSGGKFSEAFKFIIEGLNESQINDEDIDAMEAENKQLREEQMQLLTELNGPSTSSADASLVVVSDMILRQKALNQFRSESRKNRSQESNAQTSTWKKPLENVDSVMTLPYHDVLEKIKEMDDKIAENRSVIKELTQQHTELTQNQNQESEAEVEDIRFIEILRCVVEEQRKLIEKLKEDEVNEDKENEN